MEGRGGEERTGETGRCDCTKKGLRLAFARLNETNTSSCVTSVDEKLDVVRGVDVDQKRSRC